MAEPTPVLSTRIGQMLAIDPAARAVEFERVWSSWGDIAASADALSPSVAPGERVAVLLRNRPPHVGLLLGLLRAGACVVTVNPSRGIERVRAEVASLGTTSVAGDSADIGNFAGGAGGPRWLVSDELGTVKVTSDSTDKVQARRPGVAVEMLTSGTTGVSKRIPLTYDMLTRVLAGAKHYESNRDVGLQLRTGVAIVNAPLVHVSGLFRVVQCVSDGRAFCLLERFEVETWVDAVRRHRPRTVSLVPAALRMVLDADLDPADLASLRSVVSGTAPLSAEDADRFYRVYGVPVLVSYGATEFGGGVAGWNLADHQRFWSAKRGSVGRAHPGCELRVVDPETGTPLSPDAEGLLEIKASQLGDEHGWTRTTDVGRIDVDGFVWIHGRADQAINRGGFKVHPDDVRAALERDPRVRAAAVIGRDDARLGAVPVAAVELRPGAASASPAQLLANLSKALARYEIPTELRIVDVLPRTPSGKVDLAAVRELLGGMV